MEARKKAWGHRLCARSFAACTCIAVLAAVACSDELHSKNEAANKQYGNKNYDEALKAYDNLILEYPAEQKLKMNKGAALYRLGEYEKAEEEYNQAKDVKDKKALAALHYNLGNAQYMQGDKLSAQNNQQAMEKYKGALENYIKALDARPSDKDTKWNVQLVQKKIRQMQNQQQQQQNNKDNKQNKDNKDLKNNQNDHDKNQDKDKQQDKNKQDQNKNQQDKNNQDNQKPEPTPQQKQEDMKKDEAKRLIEQFSDDDKELNKKPEKTGIAGEKKVEKDW